MGRYSHDYYADSVTPTAHQPASGRAEPPPAARRAVGASHVRCDPFDRVGSWLYPYSPSGEHSQHLPGRHLRLGWKGLRRRYFAADAINEGGVVLYNPQAMPVERYRFCGAQIVTPYTVDEIDAAGARFRHTNHDDIGFVGHLSEQLALANA